MSSSVNPVVMLGQPQQAGLYRCDAGFSAQAFHAAAARHFDAYRLELGQARTAAGLFERFANSLRFPDWFGHNWDALADCLADLSWREADGYVLVLAGLDALHAHDAGLVTTLIEVLTDVCAQWRDAGIPFWVLVPDADLPGLPPLPQA